MEAGGTLVLTFRSGVKDEHNAVVDLPLPGALRELAGVRVVDYTALLPTGAGTPSGGPESLELTIDGSLQRVSAGVWMDELEANGATGGGRPASGAGFAAACGRAVAREARQCESLDRARV